MPVDGTDPDPGSEDASDGTADDADDDPRARVVGINHVALPVGDADAAVDFYRSVFEAELRGRTESMAFLDAGDQFLALGEPDDGTEDRKRHFGLVVDDADLVANRLDAVDAEVLDTGGLDFRDPWGNRVQVVEYAAVQFSKADHVAEAMGIDPRKTGDALAELEAKGMAPPADHPARGGDGGD